MYPDNTMTHYLTKLPHRIELEGQWEVGLVEIQYPHSWYNLQHHEGELAIYSRPDGAGESEETVFRIPGGYYPTITTLLNRIELEAQRALNLTSASPVRFKYDEITRKVTGYMTGCALHVGTKIQRILGTSIAAFPPGQTTSAQVVDMDVLHSMYVYCDLVQARIIGDKMTQLLRVIPVEGNDGDMVTRIYENVHYVPLQSKTFETVEIDIRDSLGQKVPFERGTLNVTLHFRKKRRLLGQ